jgi:hypothetical protein
MIICGNILHEGFVVVMTKMQGLQFNNQIWRDLGESGRTRMKETLKKAVQILRQKCMWHGDASKANILYDSESGNVVLVDFEAMQDNSEHRFGIDGPEIISIMHPPVTFSS